MAFPLMRGYDHINVVADLDPVAHAKDEDLGKRIHAHPKLFPAGSPDFGYAVQHGTEWRIGFLGASDPSAARYALAAHLRQNAPEHEEDPKVAGAMLAAAERLDPEDGEQLPRTSGRSASAATDPRREVHPDRRRRDGATVSDRDPPTPTLPPRPVSWPVTASTRGRRQPPSPSPDATPDPLNSLCATANVRPL